MAEFTNIDISEGNQLTDPVEITDNQIGVQINWSALDEEVTVVPLQSIDGVNYVGFRDENGIGVVWKIGIVLSTRLLGSVIEVLNGVRCNYLKLKVYVGKATEGMIDKITTY